MSHRSYLAVLSIAVVGLVAAEATFNFVVDPFWMYGTKFFHLADVKVEFFEHQRLGKAYVARRVRPHGIILGSSRAVRGLSPDHSGWSAQPVYNLALVGGNMYEAYRYFEHARLTSQLEEVVLSVDLFMFNAHRQPAPDFSGARLAVDRSLRSRLYSPEDLAASLVSIDALTASINTLRSQRPAIGDEVYLANGQRHRTHGEERYRTVGYREAFAHEEQRWMGEGWFPGPCRNFAFSRPGEPSTFDYFQRIVVTAYKEDIDLHVLISPSHARLWKAMEIRGLWPDFEQWKRELTRINDQAAAAARRTPFSIWDFSGFAAPRNETVPPMDDRTSSMMFYWDASHYKPLLGDWMLDIVFADGEPGDDAWGERLTSDSIDAHLERLRQQAVAFETADPSGVAELRALAERLGPTGAESCPPP